MNIYIYVYFKNVYIFYRYRYSIDLDIDIDMAWTCSSIMEGSDLLPLSNLKPQKLGRRSLQHWLVGGPVCGKSMQI